MAEQSRRARQKFARKFDARCLLFRSAKHPRGVLRESFDLPALAEHTVDTQALPPAPSPVTRHRDFGMQDPKLPVLFRNLHG